MYVGETTYKHTCPSCQTKGDSFSVTRIGGGALYHCFRASCGQSGVIVMDGCTMDLVRPDFTPTVYSATTINISASQAKFLAARYYIPASSIRENGIKYSPSTNMLVMPIRNALMEEIGVITKMLPVYVTPGARTSPYKTRTYLEIDHPRLFFPQQDMAKKGPIYIVEDMLSAIRISKHARAACLSGVSLSNKAAHYLRNLTAKVVIALDADVWKRPGDKKYFIPAPLTIRKKHGMMFSKMEVRVLTKDPKDMKEDELIKELL